MLERAFSYIGEVKTELRKASWPWDPKQKGLRKYKELTDSTAVIFVAMILLGGFVASWDLLLRKLMAGLNALAHWMAA